MLIRFRCQLVGRRPWQSPRANPLVDPEVRSSNVPGVSHPFFPDQLSHAFLQKSLLALQHLQHLSRVSPPRPPSGEGPRSRSTLPLSVVATPLIALCRSFRAFSPPLPVCLRAAFSRADRDRFSRVRADEPRCGLAHPAHFPQGGGGESATRGGIRHRLRLIPTVESH